MRNHILRALTRITHWRSGLSRQPSWMNCVLLGSSRHRSPSKLDAVQSEGFSFAFDDRFVEVEVVVLLDEQVHRAQ